MTVSYIKMYEISELHLPSECAPLLSITRAKLSIRFLIILILFSSVCTMKNYFLCSIYYLISPSTHFLSSSTGDSLLPSNSTQD